ncbi:tetratricopeptide repeat protein [Flavobacterium noncentrifugens]|uniref:tetratricopeptide repeat protein n=1 Tax=Flavobacterium noncentrifugens TaxID=1128970 RepID=UPI0014775E27|nr:tetratricopeptide repeat protein [Flavobacterium noncentrifugens]
MNRALESFNLSLKPSEKGSYDYCNVLDNIGYIYLNARKYDKAIACFKEAMSGY